MTDPVVEAAPDNPLAGIKVLITRPAGQQHGFIGRLQDLGAKTVSLPCLDISAVSVSADDQTALTTADALVFTSINAVNSLQEQGILSKLARSQYRLAVGPTTAAALAQHDLPVVLPPEPPYNSEAILTQISQIDANLRTIAIVKGCGGRALLPQALDKIGKRVLIIDTYKRTQPVYSTRELERTFLNSDLDIVTITSNEALENLLAIVGDQYRALLWSLPLVVNSERNAQHARKLGFQSSILTAPQPGDSGQIEAIKTWIRLKRSSINE